METAAVATTRPTFGVSFQFLETATRGLVQIGLTRLWLTYGLA